MNTTTETRVPSPEQQIAAEATAPQLPAITETGPGHAPAPTLPTGGSFGNLVAAVASVMAEIQPIEKGGKNTFHDYKYARMQDILQGLTPLMGKHGLAVFQYERERQMFDDGKVLAIQYNFVVAHKSGETWLTPVPQTGMSPCRTSKGSFDDKSFAKCHTSARKYFLLSLFQIPTEDEDDPDNERTRKAATPVPGPDGRTPPHKIEPTKGETFEQWERKYLAAIRTARTTDEINQWDKLNDDLLGVMSNEPEKGKAIYDRIMAEQNRLMARLTPPGEDTAPSAPYIRPAGIPDADRDPELFVSWAIKRMDAITTANELSLIWENEISPASDGLFKPDCDALEIHYEQRLAKLGG